MGYYIKSTVSGKVVPHGIRFTGRQEALDAIDGLYRELVRIRTEDGHTPPEKFLSTITDTHTETRHELVKERK